MLAGHRDRPSPDCAGGGQIRAGRKPTLRLDCHTSQRRGEDVDPRPCRGRHGSVPCYTSSPMYTQIINKRFVIIFDALIALLTTVLCSFRVYSSLGKPSLTGIDDENITQVYGLNL